ncbi:MAG: hypothetical protein CMH54_13430 [Myxococcales bacterium]|nr:hypothetical protein [Myxococcales bacterium]
MGSLSHLVVGGIMNISTHLTAPLTPSARLLRDADGSTLFRTLILHWAVLVLYLGLLFGSEQVPAFGSTRGFLLLVSGSGVVLSGILVILTLGRRFMVGVKSTQQTMAGQYGLGIRAFEGYEQELCNAMDVAIVRFDLKGRIRYENVNFKRLVERIFPNESAQINLRCLMEAIPPLEDLLASGVGRVEIVELETPVGPRTLKVRAFTQRLAFLRGIAQVVVIADVTRKSRLESIASTAETSDRFGILANGIAHELVDSMTVAQMTVQKLLCETDPGTPAFDDLNTVVDGCRRVGQIGRYVMGFQGNDTRHGQVIADADTTRRRQVEVLQRILPREVGLRFMVPSDLPYLKISQSSLDRIVLHLTMRGLASVGSRGGILIQFSASVTPDGIPGVQITTRDSGSTTGLWGTQDRTSSTDSNRNARAAAYRLEMIEALVEEAGGHISQAEGTMSYPGGGLQIHLPAIGESRTETSGTTGRMTTRFRRPLVWVIEENHIVAGTLLSHLTRLGYLAQVSSTTGPVLEQLNSFVRLDLVVIDPSITNGASSSFLAEIRARFPRLPVLVTGDSSDYPDLQEFNNEYGAVHFLQKPFSKLEMYDALGAVGIPVDPVNRRSALRNIA